MRDLRVAITRGGGIDRWIDEFNLPRQHRHNGQTGYWTEERIRTESPRSAPGEASFRHNSSFSVPASRMFWALQWRQGADWWARELGLPRYRRGSGITAALPSSRADGVNALSPRPSPARS
jgi:hypothetical protein